MTGQPIPPTAAAELRAAMLRFAEFSGDPHPVSITAVASTRDKAVLAGGHGNRVPGGEDQAVYLVLIEGKFRLTHAKVHLGPD
jgi:hypothetical protein